MRASVSRTNAATWLTSDAAASSVSSARKPSDRPPPPTDTTSFARPPDTVARSGRVEVSMMGAPSSTDERSGGTGRDEGVSTSTTSQPTTLCTRTININYKTERERKMSESIECDSQRTIIRASYQQSRRQLRACMCQRHRSLNDSWGDSKRVRVKRVLSAAQPKQE